MVTRTLSSVALVILLMLMDACTIVSYRPQESAKPITDLPELYDKVELLSFSYVTGSLGKVGSNGRTIPSESQIIKAVLERSSGFLKVIYAPTAPALGPHINIYLTDGPSISAWCRASIWTLGIIPCYANSIVYLLHFDVFIDNLRRESYVYDISRKGITWIGLLPLFWINFFTTPYEEAFYASAYQFAADAKRDGLW